MNSNNEIDTLFKKNKILSNKISFCWEKHSYLVLRYCPKKLDINNANYENIISYFPIYKNMSLIEIRIKAIITRP